MEDSDDEARVFTRTYRLVRRERCLSCKGEGHSHENCPRRGHCYLCRKKGHVATHCDYRLRRGVQEAALKRYLAERKLESLPFHYLRARESGYVHTLETLEMRSPMLQGAEVRQSLIGAVENRVTGLSFHPFVRGVLLVGDKQGNLFMHKYMEENGVLPEANRSSYITRACFCQINEIVHDQTGNSVFVSGSDGRVQRVYCELGLGRKASLRISDERYDANPDRGNGWNRQCRMLYGLEFDAKGRHGLYIGDDKGEMHVIDPRAASRSPFCFRAHRKKISHIHINPVNSNMMVTSSNDKLIKIWDTRKMSTSFYIAQFAHEAVVSSAYFSPNSGLKLLSTSQDNKFRLWKDVNVFGGTGDEEVHPDTTVIHAHNFFRYISPFRAVWDPKDWHDDLFLCGRYLTEQYRDLELAPLDLFSADKGVSIGSLYDPNVTLRLPLNRFSPWDDSIACGASRNIYLWRPKKHYAEREKEEWDERSNSPSVKRMKMSLERLKLQCSK